MREDRRHIVDGDVERLRTTLARARRTFNLEMAATGEMVAIATRLRPNLCTLVPERRMERTTEGGLDVVAGREELARHIRALRGAAIKVSLFIAAEPVQIEEARSVGAEQIELHTGEYAHGKEGELDRLTAGAERAHALGLEVAAGHGLTQENVPALLAIAELVELNIGHALVADAVFVGIGAATRAYHAAIARGLAGPV